MTLDHGILLAAAGLGAGFINGIVGTGSLISFPALLACGFPALTANVTNTIALIPGYLGNTVGYRRELSGQNRRMVHFGIATALGSIGGAVALLAEPASAFRSVVPFLIFLSAGLMAGQKKIAFNVAERRARKEAQSSPEGASGTGSGAGEPQASVHTIPLVFAMVLCGAYAGYFGAGVSVILLGVLGALLPDKLQRLNALRTVLTLTGNLLAGIIFIVWASISWIAVALMAPTALAGGWLGSSVARKIPDDILRWGVVVFATGVGAVLLVY